MHPGSKKTSDLTKVVIGAAIEVHRDKGPGLMESIYRSRYSGGAEKRSFSCSENNYRTVSNPQTRVSNR
jgi:hypothetical protein